MCKNNVPSFTLAMRQTTKLSVNEEGMFGLFYLIFYVFTSTQPPAGLPLIPIGIQPGESSMVQKMFA